MGDRSARSRPPTGRSNIGDISTASNQLGEMPRRPSSYSERKSESRKSFSSSIAPNTARRALLNDPIDVFRPYSPEGRKFDCYTYNPPVLPNSVTDPLIPDYNTGRRPHSRPLTCPTEWIDKLQQPDILDKSSFITEIDHNAKVKMCRSYVDRNRDRLWKFDSTSYQKTPRTVAEELLRDPYFITRMSKNLNKERMYKLSNSEKTAEALTGTTDCHMQHDPFAASLTTSREIRKAKMESVLAPALLQYGRKNQRGFDHAIDFGNFSKYNGVLKTNQATTMNR